MPEQPFRLSDKPSELSVSLLIRSLKTDSATRDVSPRNYAHRSRVIRQQTELLSQEKAGDAADAIAEIKDNDRSVRNGLKQTQR